MSTRPKPPICHPVKVAVVREGEEVFLEIQLHAGKAFRYALSPATAQWLSKALDSPRKRKRGLTTGL